MNTRRLVPLLLAALVVALLPATADAKRRAKPCAAKGSDTWERNSSARVYAVSDGSDHTVYGCLFKQNKRRVLGSWLSCDCSIADESPPTVELIGRFATVETSSCPPVGYDGGCIYGFEVVDLRSGRTVHSGGEHPIDILIKPNGSLAYITTTRVVRDDRKGETTLEQGPGIQVGSLATNGSLLYWISNGVAHSAPFD